MSAPVSRTTGRSSARRAPASATCRPAPWASSTSDASASGESHSSSPRPSLTAVSSRQASTSGRARRRAAAAPAPAAPRHAPGVRVGRRHHHDPRHVCNGVADRAQQDDRLVLGRDAPQADLHERRAAARRAQGGERGRAGQIRHVADRGADRQLGGHDRAHTRDHRRRRCAERPLGRVLDVHDVGARRGGRPRLAHVHDAHQQLHDRSTRAPWLSNATTSTLPSPATTASMRRARSRPAASLPTIP